MTLRNLTRASPTEWADRSRPPGVYMGASLSVRLVRGCRRQSEDTERSGVPERPLTSRAALWNHNGRGRPPGRPGRAFDWRRGPVCLGFGLAEVEEVVKSFTGSSNGASCGSRIGPSDTGWTYCCRLVETELDRIVGALKDEPLWHASMGSKELFHSNLLAWAVERFPEDMTKVLEPWLEPGNTTKVAVYRERRHLDLVIELPGHQPLVIENKAFSLPDDDQLQRYGTAVAALAGAATLVLLSLSDPGWPDGKFASEGREWHWLSYGALEGA